MLQSKRTTMKRKSKWNNNKKNKKIHEQTIT